MSSRQCVGIFFGVVIPACAHPATASVIVRFDPPVKTVSVGQNFSMNIVADLSLPIAGWGIDMSVVNAAVANQIAGVTVGPLWTSVFASDGDQLAGLAFPSGLSGTVVLATISFHANIVGQTDANVSVTSGDLTEGFALDPSGLDTVTFEAGHIQVVPEPHSLMLAAVSLLISRRRSERNYRNHGSNRRRTAG